MSSTPLPALGTGARLTFLILARSPSVWATAAGTLVALGLTRGIAGLGPLAAGFHAEILGTTLLLMGWVLALLAIPFLIDDEHELFASAPPRPYPVPACWLKAGMGGGMVLFLALMSMAVLAGAWVLEPGLLRESRLLAGATFGWLGAASLCLWTLLLAQRLRRPALIVLLFLVLVVDLSPSVLGPLRDTPLRLLFFPVSPASLATDTWHRDGGLGRALAAGLAHDLGLWLLLVGSGGGVLRTRRPAPG